jgi:hypothetical protein
MTGDHRIFANYNPPIPADVNILSNPCAVANADEAILAIRI